MFQYLFVIYKEIVNYKKLSKVSKSLYEVIEWILFWLSPYRVSQYLLYLLFLTKYTYIFHNCNEYTFKSVLIIHLLV